MVLMNKPTSVTQNEITDAIAEMRCSKGHSDCTGHPCMVKAQILALRIDENILYDMQELRESTGHAARASAAASIAADKAAGAAARAVEHAVAAAKKAEESNPSMGWRKAAIVVGGPSACVLAIIATIWRACGWIGG